MSDFKSWKVVCDSSDVQSYLGVRALLGEQQVAIFKVKDKFYAIDAIDPFTKAAVMARGIVGDLQGKVVIASPIYKQHFCLESGQCLEDESVAIKVFDVREQNGSLELMVS